MVNAFRRTPITIAVTVSDLRQQRKQALRALAPQLRTGDSLVFLGPGSTSTQLGAWRVSRPTGAIERPSMLPKPAELVLIFDARLAPSDDLITVLVEGIADRSVGAVGSMSNCETDDPAVAAPYDPGDLAAKRAFLREIGAEYPHRYRPAQTLTAPSILIRRHGELAETPLDQLATPHGLQSALEYLQQRGEGLLVAEHAYVDCPRALLRRSAPLVSACLIVKDEAHQLEDCLRAASLLADEIVVYDTGSTDDTIAVARQLGARVIAGHWDDDFSHARNDALAHCHGEWILWVDADEQLQCDEPAKLLEFLASSPGDVDAYLVSIDNLQGTDASTVFTHPAARLFRRERAMWDGRIHEQVVRRKDKGPVRLQHQALARIVHRGYLQQAMRARNKSERNLRVAFGDLSGGSALDKATRTLSLARSYMLAGRYEEGRELCSRAVELATLPSTLRLALRTLGDALLVLRRYDEALDVAQQLKQQATRPTYAFIIEGKARLGKNEPELALAAFEHVGVGHDDDGFEHRPSMVAVQRAEALTALNRHGEACDVLLDLLRASDGLDDHIGVLLNLLHMAGREPTEAYDAIRPERRLAFLPQIVQLERSFADTILESWHHRDPSSLPLLAAAAEVSSDLPVERKLIWSARLRAAGIWAACPLVTATADGRIPAATRALAGAVAFQSFADERARAGFRAAVRAAGTDERAVLAQQIPAISPTLAAELEALPGLVRPDHAVDTLPEVSRSVLVISTRVSDLAAMSFAQRAASFGHQVTLLQPEPCNATREALQGHGITVRGWTGAPEPGSPAARRAAAVMYAARRYEVVALSASLADTVHQFRELFPISSVLVIDETSEADHLEISSLFGISGTVPSALRNGICIVADWEDGTDSTHHVTATRILGLLDELVNEPLTFLNAVQSPTARQCFPAALFPAALANPLPWISTARVLLVSGVPDAPIWKRLGEVTATPVLIDTPGRDVQDSARQLRSAYSNEEVEGRHRSGIGPATAGRVDPVASIPRRSPTRPKRSSGDAPVHLKGSVYALDSLAQVNRELARHLHVHLGDRLQITTPEAPASGLARAAQLSAMQVNHGGRGPTGGSVEVRHQWPPDFSPSSADHLVVIQPWEFGVFPAEWIGPIRDLVDELWVPTTWVRDCAMQSGIDRDKVFVVPNGVDTERFTPNGPKYPLRTQKSTRFLYVGGCIERKGVDVLLETYLTTFSRNDDVCLVIKPYGSNTIYRGLNLEDDIRRAAASNGPEIELIDSDLDLDEISALYRSCTALVHPYRGEGFGLPIAEAMASGLPVVTTNGGACLDYCDESVGWLIDSRVVPTVVPPLTPTGRGWWWLEPTREHLAAAMQQVAADHTTAHARGTQGRVRILESFTWRHAAEIAATRLDLLIGTRRIGPLEFAAKGAPA
ncbi:MAG: glycosyltransferase [Actinomycetota bacterium]|nr:glycosyltransferase [Actinomycetota bacterium]